MSSAKGLLALAGERWLIADRDGATIVAAGTGVTAGDLARALAAVAR